MSDSSHMTDWTRADFFAFRTPLLSVDELLHWADGVEVSQSGDLQSSRAILRSRLRAVVLRPEVREALFVATPSLDDGIPAWLDAPDNERGRKVERALVRYIQRMAARCTPFGLFAGTSIGSCG